MGLTLGCGPQKAPQTDVRPDQKPEQARVIYEPQTLPGEAHFEVGLEAMAVGDLLTALDAFDQALLEMLACAPPSGEDPAWETRFDSLVEHIHTIDRERYDLLVDQEAGSTRSALDRLLADIDLEGAPPAPAVQLPDIGMFADESIDQELVARLVELFRGDRAHIIRSGLERATRYVPMIRQVLAEEGLPLALCWLPLIESAYINDARSRAAAVGMWQFVRAAARDYDLRVDGWVDERRDPLLATRAAARYFKSLYEQFDSWELALCAYNAGPGRVRRAIRRAGTRDYARLVAVRALPRETRRYIPAFLAGVIIAEDPEAHGLTELAFQSPLRVDAVRVDFGVELSLLERELELSDSPLAALNPSLVHEATPVYRAATLYVPAGYGARAESVLASIPDSQKLRGVRHRVRRGDTLSGIASRYGTRVSTLMQANGIRNPRHLRIGQNLVVPILGRGGSWSAADAAPINPERVQHRVRRGDTLYQLAKRYRTTIPSIMSLNPDLDPLALRPGARLTIDQGDRQGANLGSAAPTMQYSVRRGDTLSGIARRYGVRISALLRVNGLRSNSTIFPGQNLKIPQSSQSREVLVYKVRPGDTLSAIAARYRTNVGKLMEWNRLSSQHRIRVGQTILIYR